ncbi:3-phenylpropionate/trans-cinnamate dioxygenase ferredoxin reductase subunit [Nocardioides sp. J9]|uniref:NAD(P)/FAD-dependent oxidoreductase n=1 Tax=Nocardioides sp. J9 TaxID=935844 RepID=UPI0011AA6C9A|nr:FAD-dependent oxidoreductase [Nocardioides sp. J9]TWH00877.1 3-phenylpropionate/trans-cinnamate dioxygenase ferredoxin reductase subunit [Nocardioides sp. J9]
MTNPRSDTIVIVGAGHGGANVAALLRQQGFEGAVVLVGDEPMWPYQRPPLSKDYLKGAMSDDDLLIKPKDFYADQRIDVRFGNAVEAIDTEARTVTLGGGESISYDTLVLATGAAPRQLPVDGADLDGVHYLRNHDDALRLGADVVPAARLAIVGGGYVGLEVAASARHLGASAVVLEREARALARVAGADLAAFLVEQHAARGTEIRTSADVVRLDGDDGRVTAVVLGDGSRVECDTVVVGVGAIPRTALAEQAGVACDGGVLVDDHGRTSVDGVYAVGDVTRRPLDHFPGRHRLESIPSAVEQAKQTVAHVLGQPARPHEVPWFWSDQYDLKVKIAGLVGFADRSVVRGDVGSGRFAVFHLSGDAVVAVETVNSAPDFMVAKKLIASSAHVDAARLADPSVPLKELLA